MDVRRNILQNQVQQDEESTTTISTTLADRPTSLLIEQIPVYLVVLRRIRRPTQVILLVPTAPVGIKF